MTRTPHAIVITNYGTSHIDNTEILFVPEVLQNYHNESLALRVCETIPRHQN
jgi:hypothetical protein